MLNRKEVLSILFVFLFSFYDWLMVPFISTNLKWVTVFNNKTLFVLVFDYY